MQQCLVEECKRIKDEDWLTDNELALELVRIERKNQNEKWGVQDHSLSEWCTILGEEFGELCEAVNETVLYNADKPEKAGIENILKECVHVSAVAVQILEKIIPEV